MKTSDLGDFKNLRRLAGILDGQAAIYLLRAGIHRGLFEALRTPHSSEELAERMGLAPDLVAAWLRGGHAHGWLRRQGRRYQNGPFARWLLQAPEARALHSLIDQAVEHYGPRLEAISELMKGGDRPSYGSSEEAERTARASRVIESRALVALDRVPGARKARRVIDIGCGHGTYLAGLLARYRDAFGVGVELDPDVAEGARRQLHEADVARRGEILTGDFMNMEVSRGSFDLALLNNNIYYFPPHEHLELFGRVMNLLAPRGVLAIQTPVVQEKGFAQSLGLTRMTTTLDLVLRSHRNMYGVPDAKLLRRELRQAGFKDTGQVPIVWGGTSVYVWGQAPRKS